MRNRKNLTSPHNITALFKNAETELQKGNLLKSERLLRKILKVCPDHADTCHLLGIITGQLGQYKLSSQFFTRAIKSNPNQPAYYNNLSLNLLMGNRPEEALETCDQAIKINPQSAEAHKNRGDALRSLGRLEESLTEYNRAIQIKPLFAEAYNAYGSALKDLNHPLDAKAAYEQACSLKPQFAEAHYNLGIILSAIGSLNAAELSYRRALEPRPDYKKARSNLLFLLGAAAKLSPTGQLKEQQLWDNIHGEEGRMRPMSYRTRKPISGRRLRIGYVSPDLHGHAVSRFFEPLLTHHDPTHFEIFCYDARVLEADTTTGRLQNLAEHWRPISHKTDAELATLIHKDGIDILIDLAGHTGNNRLTTFTYRPAPIQATYLGYFASTGLSAIDYWITDEVLHPPDTSEQTVENIYRLPRCSHCYLPPENAPTVSPCPNDDDKVVFGSFSNLSKIVPEVIETWSQILGKLPGSRLLLTTKYLDDPKTRQLLLERFSQHGIQPEQLLMSCTPSTEEWLATYAKVDIVLDPFPRTGCTTTAEALWMGLPVVTLCGQRYAERASAMVLTATGLQETITHSPEEYIDKALKLARAPARRAELRSNLRKMMSQSELCDGASLTQAMETAYISMWNKFQSGSD